MSELRCPYCGNEMIAHRIWELSGSGKEIELHQYGCVECGAEAPAALTKEHARAAAETWKPKWISVKESLPETDADVLCWYEYYRYGDYNCMHQTYGIGHCWHGIWGGEVTCGSRAKVLLWMPLPNAPEVEA